MTKKIIAIALFFGYSNISTSTEVQNLHAALHITTGFAVQAVAYGTWKKILGPKHSPLAAHILATATTALAAGVWEAKGPNASVRDFGHGMVGAGAFSASAVLFNF